MSFEHLQENAKRAFEDARKYSESKPDVADEAMADGHLLMATYHLANTDEAYIFEVANLIDIELKRFPSILIGLTSIVKISMCFYAYLPEIAYEQGKFYLFQSSTKIAEPLMCS